jgi:trigger factor
MTYEAQRPSPCLVRLTASLSPAEAQEVQEQVTLVFARRAKLPGFRPGKAPRQLVARRFAQDIREETEERLLRKVWDQVVAEEKLKVAGPLGILEAHWDEDGGFRFTGEFEVYPSLNLPPLENFQPPAFDPEPKEEEVEQFLQGLAQRHASWVGLEEGQAEDGMLVEAEVEGRVAEGSGENFREELAVFELGAGEVFPEIEAALRGLKIGEETTARREIPGGQEESSVSVEYKLKLKGLRKKVVPEIGEELAAHLGVEGGLEGLKEKAREALRRGKKREHWKLLRKALVSYLLGQETVPLPSRLVEEETRKAAVRYAETLHRQGVKVEELNWEELAPKLRASVEEKLREELVLDSLAEELKVGVTDEEVDAAIRQQAREGGVPYAELRGNLAKSGGLEQIRAILRRERAVSQVLAPLAGAD